MLSASLNKTFPSYSIIRVFMCSHTIKFRTRPLASTASGMASDSVRSRGGGGGSILKVKSKEGLEFYVVLHNYYYNA